MQKIVIWDPSGKLPEGAFVAGERSMSLLDATEGVVALPVDPDLIDANAVGGWFKRAWGTGWRFERMVGQRGCPMMIRVKPVEPLYLYWVARVMHDERQNVVPHGILRLTADGTQGGISGGISGPGYDLQNLGKPDRWGGWTIGGRSQFSTTTEGFLGMSLYGAAQGIAVPWTAVSLSRYPVNVPWAPK